MTQRTGLTSDTSKDVVYTCLAHHRRRRLLVLLEDSSSPVSPADLATRLVADESDSDRSVEDVSEDDATSVLVELQHTHLPTLDDAGFVDWDRDADTVALADRTLFEDPVVAPQLASLEESRDRLLSALADRRRRLALSLASRSSTSITREELAAAMVARERAMGLGNGRKNKHEAVDALETKLYHQHLPKLENAGLVAYDHDGETITYVGHPDVEAEWFDHTVDDPQCPVLEIAPPQAKL
ncbi:hypothetical protein OB955_03520 [Halobacteria archaeon AArc-m2/3/4]|uniref:DUF7344 domain-containing protein n=1 Tax=Natronoglomus mannanivorans TaxID=2979990 RepID=A0ABT2QA71_9EURY|nr:hypothetical protein [Halobacteria archaeon AArc-m2/3/4]